MAKKPNPKVVTKKHLARLERERQQNRLIIIVSIVIVVLVVGLIGYGVLDQTVLAQLKPVAKVGNTVITVHDFVIEATFTRIQLVNQYTQYEQLASYFGNDQSFQQTMSNIQTQLTDPQTLGTNALNELIDNVIIREEAAKLKITVTKAELDKAVQAAFLFYPNGSPTPTITPTTVNTPTDSAAELALIATMVPTLTNTPAISPTPTLTFTPTVAPTNTPIPPTGTPTSDIPTETSTAVPTATPYTQQGYQTAVSNYMGSIKTYNLSESDMRKLIENNLYRQKVMDAITSSLKPEQDQVWARHILVADLATAQKVEAALKRGTDWATLAREYSTDTSTKDKGGDLGWFGKGTMVAEFENAAWAMKVGTISGPIKTQYGYHIIQVLGHEVRPLTDSQFTQYKQTYFNNWLTNAVDSRKDIQKYNSVWQAVVPTIPTLPPTQAAGTNP